MHAYITFTITITTAFALTFIYITSHCIALHCITLYYMALHGITLHALHYLTLRYFTLDYIRIEMSLGFPHQLFQFVWGRAPPGTSETTVNHFIAYNQNSI